MIASKQNETRKNRKEMREGEKHLRRAFERRWKNLERRTSDVEHLGLPDRESLWMKVKECWDNGFRCFYCGVHMELDGQGPSSKSFSLDHKVPVSSGGDNSIENIVVACKGCNTAKGTLPYELFEEVIKGKKIVPANVPVSVSEFFKLTEDGWSSGYESIATLLKHLVRRGKSEATRRTYLQQIKGFCCHAGVDPDEAVNLPKEEVERRVQDYADSYYNPSFSNRTANNILAVLRTFFEVNGFKNHMSLDVEGYYTPRRYRKEKEYIPSKHEIYLMADSSESLRDRAIILTLFSSGLRNSTLRALRYKDVRDELLRGISNLKLPVYPEMKQIIPDACKNNLPYFTFICDEATQAVKLYLKQRAEKYGAIEEEDPLFASEYNQIDREVRASKFLTSRQVQKVIKSAAKSAGIPRWEDINPSSLRKSFESVLRSENADGGRLDPKVQEFFMGHTLPGSQDNYFDPTKVEDLRAAYSKLNFGRVVVGNKFKRLRSAVFEAFQGTGIDPDEVMEEYVRMKEHFKSSLEGG